MSYIIAWHVRGPETEKESRGTIDYVFTETDHYQVCEDEQEAQKVYAKLLKKHEKFTNEKGGVYSVSMCAVLESTDYDPVKLPMAGKESKGKYKLLAAFGTTFADYVSEHGFKKFVRDKNKKEELADDPGEFKRLTFSTEAERQAYINGVEDMDGWEDHYIEAVE